MPQIVSGGQTGVDRAALDVALEFGIPCGGWCPLGRRAEDGTIPDRYPLTETPFDNYEIRTEWNVRDSDATLILTSGPCTGGTELTRYIAEKQGKPCLVVDLDQQLFPTTIADWLQEHRMSVLNIAGPRESGCPGIYDRARQTLQTALAQLATNK